MKPAPGSALRVGLTMLLAWVATAAVAGEPVTLHWFPRPPFHYIENDRVTGLLVEPIRAAFEAEGIPYRLENTPATRLYNTIRNSSGLDCGLGWYKNRQREAFARFSQAFYLDAAIVGVVRKSKGVPPHISAAELLTKWEIRALVKQTFTHGAYLDSLLSNPGDKLHVERISAEVPKILQMVSADRADLALMLPVEADYVFSHGVRAEDFQVLHFPDVPAKEYRYLMCSQKIPDDMMLRINKAISRHVHLAAQP
jgi:polar amino acid transport system substrate-binding protein